MNAMRKPISAKSGVLSLLVLALAVGGFILPACSAQSGGSTESGDDVLATINGEKITRDDLEEAASDDLERAEMQLIQCQANYRRTRHDVMDAGLRNMVREKLMETEAAKRGISKEELVAAEVDGKITEVTDEEVDAWYEQNKARVRGTKEQLGPQIKNFLAQQRRGEVNESFLNGLESAAKVEYFLEPLRVEVASTGAPAQGPENAPVTIVEFSDFECPFCARLVPTIEQVKENYGDKVRVVFRQFPLAMHPNARKAAEASLCAEDQGKFWEMHDLMFDQQRQLSVPELKAKAETLGLDTAQFNECLDNSKHAARVEVDLKDGSQAGVSGTPAMFVNGRFISGAVPYQDVATVIDDELKRSGGK